MPSLFVAAVLAALSFLPPGAAPPPPLPAVAAVLDHFVDAVGGPTVMERVWVRHCRGIIIQDLSWADPPHSETPFVAEADAGGCVRYAESSAWADLPDTNSSDLQAKLRWILHPRFALQVEEFFPGLRVTGRETRAGRPVVVLAPRDLPPEHYALYFDEETGLLNHVGYHNDVQEWRSEGGVMVPHRWVFGRKGGHTTYIFEAFGDGAAPGD